MSNSFHFFHNELIFEKKEDNRKAFNRFNGFIFLIMLLEGIGFLEE